MTSQPASLALLALLCFQSARLPGRVDKSGNLLQLKDQDRSLWNEALVRQGEYYLQQASQGEIVSSYHLEAAIAFEHCNARSYAETNWKRILQLYNWLLEIKPDVLIALNRLIVYAEVNGPQASLEEIQKMPDKDLLKNYYLYPAAMGEWHAQLGNLAEAIAYFEQAIGLTHSATEKELLKNKITRLL